MPPKTVRKRQLELSLKKAREEKKGGNRARVPPMLLKLKCELDVLVPTSKKVRRDFTELLTMSEEALDIQTMKISIQVLIWTQV